MASPRAGLGPAQQASKQETAHLVPTPLHSEQDSYTVKSPCGTCPTATPLSTPAHPPVHHDFTHTCTQPLQGAGRRQPAVGCVLCARRRGPPCSPDVHGERSPAEQLQPAAGQPAGPGGPPHHQDPPLSVQVLTHSTPTLSRCHRQH